MRLDTPIAGGTLWVDGDPAPNDPSQLVVCPDVSTLAELEPLLRGRRRRVLAMRAAPGETPGLTASRPHIVITVADAKALTRLLALAAQAEDLATTVASDRLAALTESLSDVLTSDSPLDELIEQLARVLRASVAIVDQGGRQLYSTGPIPLALLERELSRGSGSQMTFEAEGWRGTAVVLGEGVAGEVLSTWLLAASRREEFPDSYERAAVRVGAGVAMAVARGSASARHQQMAVRASTLERALDLQVQRDDHQLTAQLSGLGFDFNHEMRVLAITVSRPRTVASLTAAAETARRSFQASGVTELSSIRGDQLLMLVQAGTSRARQILTEAGLLAHAHIGIGRRVAGVGDVPDSYHDANLALRLVRRRHHGAPVASFEDFDLATRLFADVGLDRMSRWATEFLSPLDDRQQLLIGLRVFFSTGQNIKAAASALGIHHNSIRYRVAKAEELLGVDLSDPAAVASVYLALTAIELTDADTASVAAPVPRRPLEHRVHDTEPPEAVTRFVRSGSPTFGAAFDPDR